MKLARLVVFFLLILACYRASVLAEKTKTEQDTLFAASDSSVIAEITGEEFQSYQSEFFPLSLAEMGRQSAPTWRGMPPGYMDYTFENMQLILPLWGYWDNQFIPMEIIQNRQAVPYNLKYRLSPVPVKLTDKPISRVAYTQDFQFGLSYVDANLKQYFTPKSYFRLGGNNLVRNGSSFNFTKIQVNTYRGQIHHQFSKKLSADLWYWQLRHRFRITPFPLVDVIRKVHRVGQLLWVNLKYQPDSTQYFNLMPYGNKWGEQYRTQSFSEQRKIQIYAAGIKLNYNKKFEKNKLRILTDVKRNQITKALHLEEKGQWESKLKIELQRKWGNINVNLAAGYHAMQEVGNAAILEGRLGWKLPIGVVSSFQISQAPQNIPLAPLFWKDDSITQIVNSEVPLRQGISFNLKNSRQNAFYFSIKPFYHQFKNKWSYLPDESRFAQKSIDNAGITTIFDTQLLWFHLNNEFTYSSNYQESFIPQINNVTKINLPISLFDNALKLDGYAIYHYIGNWRMLSYDYLTNQYVKTNLDAGGYHLLDFKVLAHVKKATIFLIWENTLSEDYAIVDGFNEFFRLFRFGIYWTFFN